MTPALVGAVDNDGGEGLRGTRLPETQPLLPPHQDADLEHSKSSVRPRKLLPLTFPALLLVLTLVMSAALFTLGRSRSPAPSRPWPAAPASPPPPPPPKAVTSVHPLFELSGRWTYNVSTEAYMTAWSGSTIRFSFFGTRLNWTPGPSTQSRGVTRTVVWTVNRVHRGEAILQPPRRDSLTLVDELAASQWLVEIWLADYEAVLELGTFETSINGSITAPPPRQSESVHLHFIGDSLTAGFQCREDFALVDSFNSYPALIAQKLGAHLNLIAFPGIALMDDQAHLSISGMVTRYDRTGPQFDALQWNASWDAPVTHCFVNIGTNDLFRGTPAGDFVEALSTFLGRLLALHGPTLQRAFVIDPFGVFLEGSRQHIFSDDVAAMLHRDFTGLNGQPRIDFIDTEGWISPVLTQDLLHPTVQGHQKIADRLVAYL